MAYIKNGLPPGPKTKYKGIMLHKSIIHRRWREKTHSAGRCVRCVKVKENKAHQLCNDCKRLHKEYKQRKAEMKGGN